MGVPGSEIMWDLTHNKSYSLWGLYLGPVSMETGICFPLKDPLASCCREGRDACFQPLFAPS